MWNKKLYCPVSVCIWFVIFLSLLFFNAIWHGVGGEGVVYHENALQMSCYVLP